MVVTVEHAAFTIVTNTGVTIALTEMNNVAFKSHLCHPFHSVLDSPMPELFTMGLP